MWTDKKKGKDSDAVGGRRCGNRKRQRIERERCTMPEREQEKVKGKKKNRWREMTENRETRQTGRKREICSSLAHSQAG